MNSTKVKARGQVFTKVRNKIQDPAKLFRLIDMVDSTPRALIRAMVECIQPEPRKTIADPACGTGGFFLAACDFLVNNHSLDKAQ